MARISREKAIQEPEFRSSGVQEFRSSGVQEFRSSGVQEFRSSVRLTSKKRPPKSRSAWRDWGGSR
jgi:hypothetical protein